MTAFLKTLFIPTKGLYSHFVLVAVLVLISMASASLHAPSITQVEYFFGNDPGIGNATAIAADANTGALTQDITISVASEPDGFNTLTIRAQDSDGTWSLYGAKRFYIINPTTTGAGSNPAVSIAGAEYFFDADPGIGSGTALTISGNPMEVTESFVIPLGNLDDGYHTLTLRTQNADGTWSLFERERFFIIDATSTGGGTDPAATIAGAEYFYDADPGIGMATALAIAGNPMETIESFVLPLGTLEAGYHSLTLRTQDANGTWSIFYKKRFYVVDPDSTGGPSEPLSPLTEAEFLYDAELGFGTGTAVAITPTGNPDEYLVEIPTDMVNCDIHDVSLTVKNAAGGYSMYKIAEEIDVFDNLPPTIVSQDITVQLDATGNASIVAADVDDGTFDDCQLVSVTIDITDFDCTDRGENTVTITATDAEGKISTETVIVTVVDEINPVAIGQNITVQLDANGTVTVDPSTIDDGSTDNCAVAGYSLDTITFSCATMGANTVTFTVTDTSGNTATTNVVITVEETTPPNVITQDITVQLDINGDVTIDVDAIDNGSNDNCGIASRSLDISSFTCANIGENTVTLTVIDDAGNSASGTAVVTVEDNLAPILAVQDISVELDANGSATITAADIDNGTSDNCTISSLSIDIDTFGCSSVGANTVNFTAEDQSGNSATVAVTVTITDPLGACIQAPTAVCQAIIINADANCQANAVAADFDGGSTDPQDAPLTFTVDPMGPYNVGITHVTLTVSNGTASDSCNTTITVLDNTAPVANCAAPFTVQLDASGNASITVSDIDNGSTDTCGIASTSIDITNFNCGNIGENTVTLTVTDVGGNVSTCTTVVTVTDPLGSCNEAPIAVCQSVTVSTDANCEGNATALDFDGGSTDPQGTPLTFTVDPVGPYPLGTTQVTLTVSNGTSSGSCTTTITVEDNTAPVANCAAPFTVQLDANGNASITAMDIDDGSSDNCRIASMTIDKESFDCSDIGENTVTLTVTDSSGNISTCTTVVNVEDSVAPIANCAAPFTVQLDASGNASITVSDIDNGSTDACGIASITIDRDTFDCSDVGQNKVTLTVTDSNGNVSTCSTFVTVEDSMAPNVIIQDITVQLDANGNASITASDIDDGSSDNCSIASMTIDEDAFDCSEVGAHTVTLTVTDVHGNSSSATATVTVEDTLAPTVITQDITVQLDANGNASITATDIDDNSSDNCSIASITIDKESFNCSDVGAYTVTLTVTDIHGNSSSATATITVEDPLQTCDVVTPTDNFVTTWITTMSNETITIPTTGSGYNYSVDWGDGNTDAGKTGNASHTYATSGTYTVSISGNFPRIYFNNSGDRLKIKSIEQWGTIEWSSMNSAFMGCENLVSNATDTPDFSMVTDMYGMFAFARAFNGEVNMGNWNVSNVTTMYGMFAGASVFNYPIGTWNVGNVTTMENMFYGATMFNQSLNAWNVGSVTTMKNMFTTAMRFRGNISNWDVSNVTTMNSMFKHANLFNGAIGNWNVSNVTDMYGMFAYARKFNAAIGSWNVSNVTNMNGMFGGASVFNQNIGTWSVGNVTNMESMFYGATVFNQEIGAWDVGNVTNMKNMFTTAMKFNGSIGNWNVSNVTSMGAMFANANQFDQDLGSWDVSLVTNMTNMFRSVKLSTANYDALLTGWSNLPLKGNLKFHGGNSNYCAGETARQNIISTSNWTITDGGKDCTDPLVGDRLDLNNNGSLFGVTLYPNPMADQLNVGNPKNVQLENISIYDLTGRLVQQVDLRGMTSGTTIDVSKLSSATYMVLVNGKDGQKSELIIKE